MNFAVTKPYLVQKWSVVSKIDNTNLDDFYYIDGNKLVDSLLSNQIKNFTGEYSYDNVNIFVDNFINKFKPLAINKYSYNWIDYYYTNDLSIVFIDSNWQNIELNPASINWKTKVFVALNAPKVIFKWDFWNNIIFMTKNEIYFDDLYCDDSLKLNWLFIANKFSSKNLQNNDLTKDWCNNGQLIVKGNLIWNIDDLFNTRRSILKDFWIAWVDKLDLILNWWAIVVETNIDMWKQIPNDIRKFFEKYIYSKK